MIGIPTLVVLDKTGKLISKEGRKEVSIEGEMAWDQWLEKIEASKTEKKKEEETKIEEKKK